MNMKYTEILEMLKLEGAKPLPVWDVFTGEGWYKNNGYVTIPDTLPFNYLDKHYRILDLTPIHSMTYEGYAWVTGLGEVKKAYFDMHPLAKPVEDEAEQKALQEIKERFVTRVFGYDDDHIEPIAYPGMRGAVFLKKQLQSYEQADKTVKEGQMKLKDFTSFITDSVVVFVTTDGDDCDSELDGKRYKARYHEEFYPDAEQLTESDYDLTVKTFRPEEHEDYGGRYTYVAVYAG